LLPKLVLTAVHGIQPSPITPVFHVCHYQD
jgi:hypothetical protein